MKLWMGGEIESDVADQSFRDARAHVEKAVNALISGRDYDLQLDSWDCIMIIRNDCVFEEITRYSPKRRDMDFRLQIDHAAFKRGTQRDREKLICRMLERSLDLLGKKKLSPTGLAKLRADFETVVRDRGWSAD